MQEYSYWYNPVLVFHVGKQGTVPECIVLVLFIMIYSTVLHHIDSDGHSLVHQVVYSIFLVSMTHSKDSRMVLLDDSHDGIMISLYDHG